MFPAMPTLEGSDDISAHNMSVLTEVLNQTEVLYSHSE